MKSIFLALVIGVSGSLCAMQSQGTKRSAGKKTTKTHCNRCNRGCTQRRHEKQDAAIKSFIATKYSCAQPQSQAQVAGRPNPNPAQVSQPSHAQPRRGQGQVAGRSNPAPVSHFSRAQHQGQGRSNHGQISKDEAYARQLQEELNREDLAEPDFDQISQDEAYALELQNELDQEQDLGEPNPAVVYGPQPQLDEDSDEEDSVDDSLDELPGRLSQQPGGSEAPVPSEPASIECPICMDRQTDMHAPCCLQKVCKTCWNDSVNDYRRSCPFCRYPQAQ